MKPATTIRAVAALVALTSLTACGLPAPSPSPTPTPANPSPTPSPSPHPTPEPPASFPLAVVTGLTNLKATISLDELSALATDGSLLIPCGVSVVQPPLPTNHSCVAADYIAARVRGDQTGIALLPAGLVEPATKVLPIAGDGPFGLFGASLFGDPESRALPYPVIGSASISATGGLDPTWIDYDPTEVWTLTAVGSLCADRVGAYHAVQLGKGWDWVFNGGTAEYTGPPYLNPNPPAGISVFPIVSAVETGNDGVTVAISRRSDLALADHKCPIQHTEDWQLRFSGFPSLAVPEDVLPRWRDFLGLDAVYLPADHQSDRGVAGIRSTLELLAEYGFPHTGLGMNIDEALEPAYVEVAGLKVAFASWNEVPGPVHAGPATPGVAWLTQENVDAAVGRAQAAGADLIICDPQWWGGSEYHPDLWASQQRAVEWMDAAGCDQIIGGGLHLAGGTFLRQTPNGVSMINAGPGNYQYGQPWWQQTQEGVIVEMAFRGTTLVNLRLHPYVMIHSARPSLLDPEGDGHYVLERVWEASELDY